MHRHSFRARRFSAGLSCTVLISAIASCGGGRPPTSPDGPGPAAQFQLTASPSPITPQLCPSSSCGSLTGQLEIAADLTVRETGGASGRIDSVAMTLRRNSDNSVIANGTFTPQGTTRFTANGSVVLRVAMHFELAQGSAASTFTLAVNATDDAGRAVTASLGVPVQALSGPPQPRLIEIAGEYRIVQQQLVTTCGDTGAPPSVNGTVTHTAGETPFVLRDTGGTTFSGTVQPDGSFTSNAVLGPDASGNTFTQRLEGRFTGSGFTARLNVEVQPRNCRFERDWVAAKQGAPNVIPLQ